MPSVPAGLATSFVPISAQTNVSQYKTQFPSPVTQSARFGHAAPVPDGATTSVNVRFGAFSQPSVQNDQKPTQSTFGGQSSSPGRQCSATGHGEPSPEWGTTSDQVRFSASSHCSVQFDHAPTQSMFRGQSPSPGLQGVGQGQREPLPDRGVITVKVRLAAGSQKAVQLDQKPLQSTFAGHPPSPGRHDSASGHRAPNPPCA